LSKEKRGLFSSFSKKIKSPRFRLRDKGSRFIEMSLNLYKNHK
jgi:hypothetical protein